MLINLKQPTKTLAAEIMVKMVKSKTTGPDLINILKESDWEITTIVKDGYMNLDDMGGDYSTWEAQKGKHNLYIFWSNEWWILDVSDKPLSPKDYQ